MANLFLSGCGNELLQSDNIVFNYNQAQLEQTFFRKLGIRAAATDYYEYKFGKPQKIRPASLREYSIHGNLTRETTYDSKGFVLNQNSYSYDAQDYITEKTVYNNIGTIETHISYKYNPAGKVETELLYNSAGKLLEKGIVKYNETGNKTEEVFYNAGGSVESSIIYEYNGGLLNAQRNYNSNDVLESEIKYYYDASGNKNKEEKTAGQTLEVQLYSNKLLTELYESNNGILVNKWIYKYDSNGLLLEKTGYNPNIVIDEPVSAYITTYSKY